MAKQKMVAKESTELVDEKPSMSTAVMKKRAKVNLTIPGGVLLLAGEMVELNEHEMKFLQAGFGPGITHILE